MKRIVLLAFICSVVPLHLKAIPPIPICKVVEQTKKYDGKHVYIEAIVLSSQEAVLLAGSACEGGVYANFPAGKKGSNWRALYEAIFSQSGGLKIGTVQVKVKGVFHRAVRLGTGTIRQLEVDDVIEVNVQPARQE